MERPVSAHGFLVPPRHGEGKHQHQHQHAACDICACCMRGCRGLTRLRCPCEFLSLTRTHEGMVTASNCVRCSVTATGGVLCCSLSTCTLPALHLPAPLCSPFFPAKTTINQVSCPRFSNHILATGAHVQCTWTSIAKARNAKAARVCGTPLMRVCLWCTTTV